MTTSQKPAATGHVPFLTEQDEIGLAEGAPPADSTALPADLTVHSDAASVFENSMAPLRRPVLMALAAVAAGVTLLVGGSIIMRALSVKDGTPLA